MVPDKQVDTLGAAYGRGRGAESHGREGALFPLWTKMFIKYSFFVLFLEFGGGVIFVTKFYILQDFCRAP